MKNINNVLIKDGTCKLLNAVVIAHYTYQIKIPTKVPHKSFYKTYQEYINTSVQETELMIMLEKHSLIDFWLQTNNVIVDIRIYLLLEEQKYLWSHITNYMLNSFIPHKHFGVILDKNDYYYSFASHTNLFNYGGIQLPVVISIRFANDMPVKTRLIAGFIGLD